MMRQRLETTRSCRLPQGRRGFSLIEVAVVLAMVGIIGAAAAGVCSLVLQTMKSTRTLATLGVRAQQPMLYLQSELQRAGGNGIFGAAAIVVENDCAARGGLPDCNHTDRVNVYTAIQGPVCKGRKIPHSDKYEFRWAQGGCCLNSTTDPDSTPPLVPFVGHLMLQTTQATPTTPTTPLAGPPKSPGSTTKTTTQLWRPIYAAADSTATCSFIVEDLLPEALLPAGSKTMADAAFVDAVLIEARTFYVDPGDVDTGTNAHSLYMHLDSDMPDGPGGSNVNGNRLLVASNIFDFQVAVGIDDNLDGQYAAPEWAFAGNTTVPASYNQKAPGLVWFTMITGLDAKTGHGSPPVRSPLMGPTKAIGGPGTELGGVLLRSASLQVAPLNARLGPGAFLTTD